MSLKLTRNSRIILAVSKLVSNKVFPWFASVIKYRFRCWFNDALLHKSDQWFTTSIWSLKYVGKWFQINISPYMTLSSTMYFFRFSFPLVLPQFFHDEVDTECDCSCNHQKMCIASGNIGIILNISKKGSANNFLESFLSHCPKVTLQLNVPPDQQLEKVLFRDLVIQPGELQWPYVHT